MFRSPIALICTVATLFGCGDDNGAPASDATGRDVAIHSADTVSDTSVDARETLDTTPTGPWRSALYPSDWTPEGASSSEHWLHDFSYAGYRNGEAEPGQDLPQRVIDVVLDHGADPTGSVDATTPAQDAIDAATTAEGGIVFFPAGIYRFDGKLVVSGSRVVLRGAGADRTHLYFTSSAGMDYDSHIRFAGVTTGGAEAALAADAGARTTAVTVADASAFAVGDDVAVGWVITPDFIARHGMSEHWISFNDTWQPFFRRTIVGIDQTGDAAQITMDVPLRYPALVRDQASVRREPGVLHEVGVEKLGLANAVSWDHAWAANQVHVLQMDGVADAWIRDVASFASPMAPTSGPGAGSHLQSGGILVRHAKRVTVADSQQELAQNRGGGGNGYLFEVRQSSEVLFRDCVGRQGRHNFIQNWGFGASGIVWLRVDSREGKVHQSSSPGLVTIGDSEFHHSLAMANLIDASRFDDGWSAINRKHQSSGAGHTATESVFWNVSGEGRLRSYQFGRGYVIGTASSLDLQTVPTVAPPGLEDLWDALAPWVGAAPDDWVEGEGRGAELVPSSLYEDQLARRLGR